MEETQGMDYGSPAEDIAQEFSMHTKNILHNLLHSVAQSERTIPEIIAEGVIFVLTLPFAVIYAIVTYNPAMGTVFKFFYLLAWWYFFVAFIFFAFFMLENIYKTFFSARLALLGRLRPWKSIRSFIGVQDTMQNNISARVTSRVNNFTISVVKVPMTGLMLQVMIATMIDTTVAAMVSLGWPITTSIFIITTLFTCRAPTVFYEYTIIENTKIDSNSGESYVVDEMDKKEEEEKDEFYENESESESEAECESEILYREETELPTDAESEEI